MKMKQPKLSIVIPSYNSRDTIISILNSIYTSSYKNFEVILVDDCSRDNSAIIAKEKFPIRLISLKKNHGAAYARNLGVRNAKGEIIIFIDSDVTISYDALNRIDEAFDDKSISALQTIYSKRCPVNNFASQYQNLYQYYNFNLIKSRHIQIASTYCFAIRKENFIEFEVNKKTTEDGEWGFRLHRDGGKILLDKSIEVEHLQRFTLKSILKRSFRLSKDKITSIKNYREQIKTNLNSTHHNKAKMMAILFSFIPPLFWVLNIRFFRFVYTEKGFNFLLKTILFHELNYFVFLLGMIRGIL